MKMHISLVRLDLKKTKALLFSLRINSVNFNLAKPGMMNILLRFKSKAGMSKYGKLILQKYLFSDVLIQQRLAE